MTPAEIPNSLYRVPLKGSIRQKYNKIGILKQIDVGPTWDLGGSRWVQNTPIGCGGTKKTEFPNPTNQTLVIAMSTGSDYR